VSELLPNKALQPDGYRMKRAARRANLTHEGIHIP